jgi:acetylglutamate kinase
VVVVHGGGRAIDADLEARGKTPHFVDGLRVTDEDTLATVVACSRVGSTPRWSPRSGPRA